MGGGKGGSRCRRWNAGPSGDPCDPSMVVVVVVVANLACHAQSEMQLLANLCTPDDLNGSLSASGHQTGRAWRGVVHWYAVLQPCAGR